METTTTGLTPKDLAVLADGNDSIPRDTAERLASYALQDERFFGQHAQTIIRP